MKGTVLSGTNETLTLLTSHLLVKPIKNRLCRNALILIVPVFGLFRNLPDLPGISPAAVAPGWDRDLTGISGLFKNNFREKQKFPGEFLNGGGT
jgi:hypothetical protein